jgi:predicted DNA-binding transcriptional regulator YafY
MLNRDKLRLVKKHYFVCPNLIFELGLSINAIGIFCYMVSKSEEYNPSIREIADLFSISRRTVYRAIDELLAAKVIYCIQPANRFNKKSAIYAINGNTYWTKLVAESDNNSHAVTIDDTNE